MQINQHIQKTTASMYGQAVVFLCIEPTTTSDDYTFTEMQSSLLEMCDGTFLICMQEDMRKEDNKQIIYHQKRDREHK